MHTLERRRFDHFAVELSLALRARVPRHPLWLLAAGSLSSGCDLALLCGAPLDELLRSLGLAALRARDSAGLKRKLVCFEPARRTPEEVLGALFTSA